jgi:hypothetical protein
MPKVALRVLALALWAGPVAFAPGALLPAAAAAAAARAATLRATLQPKTLGASTTISIGFRIAANAEREPPPLSSFAVRLPSGMGFAGSTLGLATCSEQTLLAEGAGACPRESVMGFGSAQVRAPFGTQAVGESGRITIFMTQPVEGRTTMLFYFDGRKPVIAPLVLQTEILTPESSVDSVLSTEIPPIPTAPGGANVSMLSLQANIGPSHVWYFKRVHGRTVAYQPKGLNVPETCPRSGFVFTGEFGFQDGSRATSRSVVPCPPRGARSRKPAGRGA